MGIWRASLSCAVGTNGIAKVQTSTSLPVAIGLLKVYVRSTACLNFSCLTTEGFPACPCQPAPLCSALPPGVCFFSCKEMHCGFVCTLAWQLVLLMFPLIFFAFSICCNFCVQRRKDRRVCCAYVCLEVTWELYFFMNCFSAVEGESFKVVTTWRHLVLGQMAPQPRVQGSLEVLSCLAGGRTFPGP